MSLSGSVYQKDSQTINRGDTITTIKKWGGEYMVDFWVSIPDNKDTYETWNLIYVADDISNKSAMGKSMLPEINWHVEVR